MGPLQNQIKTTIRQSIPGKDLPSLSDMIGAAIKKAGRRTRKDCIRQINAALIESALESERPELLSLMQDIQNENLDMLLSAILKQYVRTQNEAWYETALGIVSGLEKKGDQSEVLMHMCLLLVEAGSSRSDSTLIVRGMDLFSRITFRKYRSEILTRICPYLIDWALAREDLPSLISIGTFTGEISDLSKRSIILAKLAAAISLLGIKKDEPAVWAQGIRTAAGIHQKIRRQTSFFAIVQQSYGSPLYQKIRDISRVVPLFTDLETEIQLEIIAAIISQMVNADKDRPSLAALMRSLAESLPVTRPVIINTLVRYAGRTGDMWCFSQAMELQYQNGDVGVCPVQDFVKAAVSVVHTTGSTDALHRVVPVVISSCQPETASRVLLQIVDELLISGELTEALGVFTRIRDPGIENPHYDTCIAAIWKHAIINRSITKVREVLSGQQESPLWGKAIYRAVADICKQHAFSEITEYADPLAEAMALHPQRDHLVLDSVTQLIRRGFLETANPDVLIRLTKIIQDTFTREQALSTIVIRVAKIGVVSRNRDFLQRAVGLSCLIEDTKTRSQTLTAVIDEATRLAVTDGDLDLLRRMREWSGSLLSHEGKIMASANIINGMITYAHDRKYPAALDEAYQIAIDIGDPSLKNEITERIGENYVRIGCIFLQEFSGTPLHGEFMPVFRLFSRGLDVLASRDRKDTLSLTMARIIDIILDSSKEGFRNDAVPALTLFALQIREGYERDAMVARITSMMRGSQEYADTNDPYERLVDALIRLPYVTEDPALLDLVLTTANQIKEPYFRLSRTCQIAGIFREMKMDAKATDLLDHVCISTKEVQGEYRQVLLLSDCIRHYTPMERERAGRVLKEAIDLLKSAEYDPESVAHRQIIGSLARYHEATGNEDCIVLAKEIASRIKEPVDYVAAMITVYHMAAGKKELRAQIIDRILKTCDSVRVPVQRVPLLLDVADIMIRDEDYARGVVPVLSRITKSIESIPVPYIADSFRSRLAAISIHLWKKTKDTADLSHANAMIAAIEHEEFRLQSAGIHETLKAEVSPVYDTIKSLAKRMITDRYSPAQVAAIESMVRSVTDRGVIVRYFSSVAILFHNTGKTQLARRFFSDALSDAGVIRPLSRRAYVLCDMALLLNHAGCREKSHEVMDLSVNAATGIRQFAERDDVFDTLSTAMRWMREE